MVKLSKKGFQNSVLLAFGISIIFYKYKKKSKYYILSCNLILTISYKLDQLSILFYDKKKNSNN